MSTTTSLPIPDSSSSSIPNDSKPIPKLSSLQQNSNIFYQFIGAATDQESTSSSTSLSEQSSISEEEPKQPLYENEKEEEGIEILPTPLPTPPDSSEQWRAALKKAAVAAAGGSLIVVGIPLVPLPGPGDLMIIAGMGVLATEFKMARRVVERCRDGLEQVLVDDEEEEGEGGVGTEERDDDGEKDEVDGSKKPLEDTAEEPVTITGIYTAEELEQELRSGAERAGKVLKKGAVDVGRNVLLPMLNRVCDLPPPTDFWPEGEVVKNDDLYYVVLEGDGGSGIVGIDKKELERLRKLQEEEAGVEHQVEVEKGKDGDSVYWV